MIYRNQSIREVEGLKIFSEEDFYWSVNLPASLLSQLIDRYESADLTVACRELNIEPRYFINYYRSDFIYFLPYREGNEYRVLDLGSGFGNITIPLAKQMPKAKIYAVDASSLILNFLKIRALKEGCTNIDYCKVDIFEKKNLPFEENSFDLIIMNGVLEWIGSGVNTGNPRDYQLEFLRYIKKFLKEDGTLYVGIEGRLFPGYFRGIKDPHSQLTFTSVIPRFLANIRCRVAGLENGYRTYTYTNIGYKKLLAQAGFDRDKTEIIYPVASYKDPFFLFSYKQLQAYKYAFKKLSKKIFTTSRNNLIYRFLYFLGLEKFFAPSYLLLASSGIKPPYLINFYLSDVLKKVGKSLPSDYEIIKVLGNLGDNGFVTFFLLDKITGRPVYVFKKKRIDDQFEKINSQINKLKNLNSDHLILPIAVSGSSQLYNFFNFSFLDPNKESLFRAIRLIRELHELEPSFCHGDYTLENIVLVAGDLKVIDFEDTQFEGSQIFDIFNLLIHYYHYKQKIAVKDLMTIILSVEGLEFLKFYDEKIDLNFAKNKLVSFLLEKQNKYRYSWPRKFEFYQSLEKSLNNS